MKTLIKYMMIFCISFGLAGAAGYTGVSLFTRSAPEVVLPDLVGKNIIQVLETLTRLGLNPKLHTTQYHETIPKYGVTFQDPEPGATIKKGRDVVIHISKGFKQSLVPDLRQVSLKQGLLRLEESQLRPGRIVYIHSSDTLKQGIIAQYPLPRTRVAADASCDLLVSKGPKPPALIMPDLRRRHLGSAADLLAEHALEIGEIRSEPVPGRAGGEVIRQTPAFGSRIMPATRIRLVVNGPVKDASMDPDALNTPVWVSHPLPPGFSNRHVRVTADLFGRDADLVNGFLKPGKNINLLIPGGIKTKIRIFVDHRLVHTRLIDPWRKSDRQSWTVLPANFFIGELP